MSYRTNTIHNEEDKYTPAEKKLLKELKFPAEFSQKIDTTKVNMTVMKPWITQRLIDLIGFEDDVVIDFVISMLENEKFPDPKRLQVNLTGFLSEKTPKFVRELWKLLLSAQETTGGVPAAFIEAKKAELRVKKAEYANIADTLRRAKVREEAQKREEKALNERRQLARDGDRRHRSNSRRISGDRYNRNDRYERSNHRRMHHESDERHYGRRYDTDDSRYRRSNHRDRSPDRYEKHDENRGSPHALNQDRDTETEGHDRDEARDRGERNSSSKNDEREDRYDEYDRRRGHRRSWRDEEYDNENSRRYSRDRSRRYEDDYRSTYQDVKEVHDDRRKWDRSDRDRRPYGDRSVSGDESNFQDRNRSVDSDNGSVERSPTPEQIRRRRDERKRTENEDSSRPPWVGKET